MKKESLLKSSIIYSILYSLIADCPKITGNASLKPEHQHITTGFDKLEIQALSATLTGQPTYVLKNLRFAITCIINAANTLNKEVTK